MTFVGKLLTILVTVCSVVFMAFAVSSYVSRSDWRDQFNTQKANLDKANKDKTALDEKIKNVAATINQEITNLASERAKFDEDLKVQQKDYNQLVEDWKQAHKDVVDFEEKSKTLLTDIDKKRKNIGSLNSDIQALQQEKKTTDEKRFEIEQNHIELAGGYETTAARLKDLEKRASDLGVRKSQPVEAAGKPTRRAGESATVRTTPVEGVILKVDPQGKFVEISIGSDDGLRKQHRLQVFRVKPQGKFVGTIEIVGTDPDRSAARILPEFKQDTIQEGDLVAARITQNR
jgi:septal ring factor EnvC (AmiA/AmiB activator)